MNRALAHRLTAVAVSLVAVVLAWEAWQRVSPALDDGWLSGGMAARVFLPLLLLGAVGLWLGRR